MPLPQARQRPRPAAWELALDIAAEPPNARVQDLIDRCYRVVPHYRALGAPPEALGAVPSIQRADFASAPWRFVPDDAPLDDTMAVFQTSGTTGHPMNVPTDAEATFDPVNFNYPHGTHLCAMEVDTETGATTMRKYVCVDDIGTIVNPLIVEGQIHGGLVQGIAQALFEGAEYDDQGTLVSGSFVDYTLPTAADTINYVSEHTTSPSTTNTLGTKGVGEAGTIASTPAVVNAVVDAVRHLGVADIEMPCTPQRVWKAIRSAGSSGGGAADESQPHFAYGAPNHETAAGATDGAGQ